MKKIKNLFILFYFLAFAISSSAFADRLKDLTSIAGIRSNQLNWLWSCSWISWYW